MVVVQADMAEAREGTRRRGHGDRDPSPWCVRVGGRKQGEGEGISDPPGGVTGTRE